VSPGPGPLRPGSSRRFCSSAVRAHAGGGRLVRETRSRSRHASVSVRLVMSASWHRSLAINHHPYRRHGPRKFVGQVRDIPTPTEVMTITSNTAYEAVMTIAAKPVLLTPNLKRWRAFDHVVLRKPPHAPNRLEGRNFVGAADRQLQRPRVSAASGLLDPSCLERSGFTGPNLGARRRTPYALAALSTAQDPQSTSGLTDRSWVPPRDDVSQPEATARL
jgi:hypothetical protein